ncbi:MAG: DUF1707 domain-containing protein [Streptosporangiaceae bacterium]
MNDRMRTSEADREQVVSRLRDHFAEGRLSADELDDRIAAALSAKTYGDLRQVTADLPGPVPAPPRAPQPAPVPRLRPAFRRGPRLLPLLAIMLIFALAVPGVGWLFFAIFKILLVAWLIACLAGIVAAARFRRHVRRYWDSGYGRQWQQYRWHNYQWRG